MNTIFVLLCFCTMQGDTVKSMSLGPPDRVQEFHTAEDCERQRSIEQIQNELIAPQNFRFVEYKCKEEKR